MSQLPRNKFSQWLEKRFLEWQYQKGERQTVTAFAKWLGVSPNVVINWMNGRRKPNAASTKLLAEKLGKGIYDALGQAHPDKELQDIIAGWGNLNQEQQRALHEQYETYTHSS